MFEDKSIAHKLVSRMSIYASRFWQDFDPLSYHLVVKSKCDLKLWLSRAERTKCFSYPSGENNLHTSKKSKGFTYPKNSELLPPEQIIGSFITGEIDSLIYTSISQSKLSGTRRLERCSHGLSCGGLIVQLKRL